MGNSFTGDPHCKALWRFESGTLLVDDINGQTLTNNNAVAEDTTNFMEGLCSALFSNSAHSYLSIPDASLVNGFPLKYGDTVKKATFCFRLRPTSIGTNYAIFGKGWNSGSPANSFVLAMNGSSPPYMGWLKTGGGIQWFNFPSNLTANHVYHVAVLIDGVNKILKVRLRDITSGTVNTWNFSPTADTLALSTGVLSIGGDPSAGEQINGNEDEFVVFDRLLSDSEIDLISNGNYVYSSPASCRSTSKCAATLVPLGACRSATICAALPGEMGICRSLTQCANICLPPEVCRSLTACEATTFLPPAFCRSLTKCFSLQKEPYKCLSQSICEDISYPALDNSRSLTSCMQLLKGSPDNLNSLTGAQDIPLAYGEGTFMVF